MEFFNKIANDLRQDRSEVMFLYSFVYYKMYFVAWFIVWQPRQQQATSVVKVGRIASKIGV